MPLEIAKHVPFILLKKGYGFRRMVLDLCAESGFKPNAAFKTSTSKSRNPLPQTVWGNTDPNMVKREKIRVSSIYRFNPRHHALLFLYFLKNAKSF